MISISPKVESDLGRIMELEIANDRYVGNYTLEKHKQLLQDPNCRHLTIKRLADQQVVGLILLFGLNDPNRVLEFRRVAIGEKGQGYGREAVRYIKKICFEELGFHRLWLDVFDDNERAIRLYESEGFKLEGILRENVVDGNLYRSQRIYSILDQEYQKTVTSNEQN